MERNNIITAPQVSDVDALFAMWKKTHMGRKSDFYDFLTSPTPEREVFLSQFKQDISYTGSIVNAVVQLPDDNQY